MTTAAVTLDAYKNAAERHFNTRTSIPFLPFERHPMSLLLDGHLRAAGMSVEATAILGNGVAEALDGLYAVDQDVCSVMHRVHSAATVRQRRAH